jgi:hypothetical protein
MVVKRQHETFAPVTLGHIRSHGCRDLLIYCVSGLLRFGCSAPRVGADVRPNCLCHLGGSDTSNGMRHSSWPSRITSIV